MRTARGLLLRAGLQGITRAVAGAAVVALVVTTAVLASHQTTELTAANADVRRSTTHAAPARPRAAARTRAHADRARVHAAADHPSRSTERRPARHHRTPPGPPRRSHPWLTPQQIAHAVGAPAKDVATHWPSIDNALRAEGMTDNASRIAAIATIVTEVGPKFRPIGEYGDSSYFRRMYDGRSDLGNIRPGDGARYHGRGYIQITGRANYRAYGQRLGVNLERHPDEALTPTVGARVLADYFKQRGVDAAARRGDWREVRLKVNGGLNGWTRYQQVVSALKRASAH